MQISALPVYPDSQDCDSIAAGFADTMKARTRLKHPVNWQIVLNSCNVLKKKFTFSTENALGIEKLQKALVLDWNIFLYMINKDFRGLRETDEI